MKKHVLLSSSEPIGHIRYKDEEQPWSDTYFRFKAKPGRKTYFYGPTLIGYNALVSDIKSEYEFLASHPKYKEKTERDIHKLEHVKKHLDAGNTFCIQENEKHKYLPLLYTSKPMITRAIAENLITHLMHYLGYPEIKIVWKKPFDDFFINPV